MTSISSSLPNPALPTSSILSREAEHFLLQKQKIETTQTSLQDLSDQLNASKHDVYVQRSEYQKLIQQTHLLLSDLKELEASIKSSNLDEPNKIKHIEDVNYNKKTLWLIIQRIISQVKLPSQRDNITASASSDSISNETTKHLMQQMFKQFLSSHQQSIVKRAQEILGFDLLESRATNIPEEEETIKNEIIRLLKADRQEALESLNSSLHIYKGFRSSQSLANTSLSSDFEPQLISEVLSSLSDLSSKEPKAKWSHIYGGPTCQEIRESRAKILGLLLPELSIDSLCPNNSSSSSASTSTNPFEPLVEGLKFYQERLVKNALGILACDLSEWAITDIPTDCDYPNALGYSQSVKKELLNSLNIDLHIYKLAFESPNNTSSSSDKEWIAELLSNLSALNEKEKKLREAAENDAAGFQEIREERAKLLNSQIFG